MGPKCAHKAMKVPDKNQVRLYEKPRGFFQYIGPGSLCLEPHGENLGNLIVRAFFQAKISKRSEARKMKIVMFKGSAYYRVTVIDLHEPAFLFDLKNIVELPDRSFGYNAKSLKLRYRRIQASSFEDAFQGLHRRGVKKISRLGV